MALVIPSVAKQYSLRIPSHRFRQGGRDVYYFVLDLETLDGLLPQRVEDSIVKEANRRLTPSHAKNIQTYLDEKDDWLLGALMLGIASDAVEFKPYSNEQGEVDNAGFGELRILTNRVNTMRIFDGQHRRRAVQDVLYALSTASDSRSFNKLNALRKTSIPVVMYKEDDIKTLRQMFVDASKTKTIEDNTVVRFDQSDAFNLVAIRLAEESRLFKNRVEMERSSPTVASKHLVAINQLAMMLKSLEVGYGRRIRRERNDAFMLDRNGLYDRCLVWADEFLPSCREEYRGILSGAIRDEEIPRLRATTFAFNVPFIRVLASCYYECNKAYGSWESLAKFIDGASIDHRSGNSLLVQAGLAGRNSTTVFYRRQEVARAIDYIVKAAGSS